MSELRKRLSPLLHMASDIETLLRALEIAEGMITERNKKIETLSATAINTDRITSERDGYKLSAEVLGLTIDKIRGECAKKDALLTEEQQRALAMSKEIAAQDARIVELEESQAKWTTRAARDVARGEAETLRDDLETQKKMTLELGRKLELAHSREEYLHNYIESLEKAKCTDAQLSAVVAECENVKTKFIALREETTAREAELLAARELADNAYRVSHADCALMREALQKSQHYATTMEHEFRRTADMLDDARRALTASREFEEKRGKGMLEMSADIEASNARVAAFIEQRDQLFRDIEACGVVIEGLMLNLAESEPAKKWPIVSASQQCAVCNGGPHINECPSCCGKGFVVADASTPKCVVCGEPESFHVGPEGWCPKGVRRFVGKIPATVLQPSDAGKVVLIQTGAAETISLANFWSSEQNPDSWRDLCANCGQEKHLHSALSGRCQIADGKSFEPKETTKCEARDAYCYNCESTASFIRSGIGARWVCQSCPPREHVPVNVDSKNLQAICRHCGASKGKHSASSGGVRALQCPDPRYNPRVYRVDWLLTQFEEGPAPKNNPWTGRDQ